MWKHFTWKFFFVPFHDTNSLFLIQGSYLNKKLRKEKFWFSWYVTIPHGFFQFWQYLLCNFEKKLFLSRVIGSVNRLRKDIKVTFAFFSFHTGRFTVIWKAYGNKLFSYFDIFKYVLSNFTLDSRIKKYLQGNIGLRFLTSLINFDLVQFRENWEKEFQLESMVLNLSSWERQPASY